MEKFTFTDRKISNRKLNITVEILIALCMSASFVMCLAELCGVIWSFSNAFSGSPAGGLVSCYNSLARNLAASDGVMLSKLSGASEECGLFLTLLTLIGAVISFVVLKAGKKILLAIAPVMFTVVATVFSLNISFEAVMFMTASAAAAWFYMDGGIRNFATDILFAAVIIAVTAGVFRIPAVVQFTENSNVISAVREKTSEFAADLYYGNNPLQGGDLTQRTRSEEQGTALELSMEDPHSMYLRGFVGEKYTGSEWQALPFISYYDFEDEAYWFEHAGLNMEGQSGQARDLVSDKKSEPGNVEIKAVKADKRYGYIPYEINSSIDGAQRMGGSFVKPEKFGRLKNYSYTVMENPVKDWTETASKLFTVKKNEEIEAYLLSESYYNSHIYENYTYLSKQERNILDKNFGATKASLEAHADYKIAINDIKKYLNENFIYTEDLGEADEEKPFLETFMKEKKGYDVHYATAATLMFRYYGIPARYVEGYLLTPEDAEKMNSGEVYELPMQRNHAWTEIYVDGLGFIPIEVCPEYEGLMEEADLSVGISNDALKSVFDESGISQNAVIDTGGADDKHNNIDIFMLILMIFAGLIVAAAILAIVRKLLVIIKEKRRKRYLCCKADPKTAVSAMFGFMEQEELPVSDSVRELGNRAAYSQESIDEDMRAKMLACLKAARKEKREIDKSEKKKKRADKRNAYAGSHRFHALFMRGRRSGKGA